MRSVGDDDRSLLEELWATPVGRRWLLKAGLGSAVALGVGSRAVPSAAARRKRQQRRTESVDLQFMLGHMRGVSRLTLMANGQRIPLERHTKATRAALRQRGGLWAAADLSKLSHHVRGVELVADRALAISVHGRRRGHDVVVAQIWRVPEATTLRLARAARRLHGSYKPVLGPRARLAALGLTRSDVRSARHVAQLMEVGDTLQTAATLVSRHPNVATIDTTAAGITTNLLQVDSAVMDLGGYIYNMQQAGHDFAFVDPATNADGTPAQISLHGVDYGFKSFQYAADAGLQTALTGAAKAAIGVVRDTPTLGAVIDKPLEQDPAASTATWVQSQGVLPQTQPYTPAGQVGAGALVPQVKNPGVVFGTQVTVSGTYANGALPLTIYNNWIRWIWVYVQYLGADNANLSLNPDSTWPDTNYCKSVGLLSEVSTILGVPIWNDNSIQVTLNYPEGSHTARLLLCGLGADAGGSGWRQYFPDDAYPGTIAPRECLVTALLTGIVTIGFTAFAAAQDIDAALTADAIEEPVSDLAQAGTAILDAITDLGIPVGEAVAVETASGTADRSANGPNIFELLYPLASGIPKILFSEKTAEGWGKVGAAILGEEAAEKIVDGIPFIGEVIGIIAAVGDVVSLAEICAETVVAPWVIENEVTLTYPATVTVSRDASQDATFPRTARSWQLEAKVDGAVVLSPVTGAINQNGQIQSVPLVVPVTAPFGGSLIQWSIVFLDAGGNQVGTGVSQSYTNNDPANPPSVVAFSITELAVPITATTRFPRDDTTGYSSAAAGYTWSDTITDSGTLADKGVQEVAGASVSTLAGVAGVVWEQGDKFYVRGVPTAQNGATIALGPATAGGYSRRPFLLLDPFVTSKSAGNHVLLEPDPLVSSYYVRPVTLDPTTGAPTWDPAASYGTFLLEVSAAALHSSGHVVVVNTDSGRLGTLLPANATPPPFATWTGGNGTQVGLLSSPTAVAVTNPGTVLVLEPGIPQISAFDLNGNPVQYFAAATAARSARRGRRRSLVTNPHYSLGLPANGSYLDLGVDGAGQIYVLYYTGDGTAPGDYRVDVYTPAGVPLNTGNTGINVPHIAVDYWRSIFGANYSALADTQSGQPHIDPALGVAEPSLSVFDPVNGAGATRRRARARKRSRRRR